LQVVKNAAQAGIQDTPINNLCERLELSDRISSTEVTPRKSQLSLPASDFPGLGATLSPSTVRQFSHRTSTPGATVLLEKKSYPSNISQTDFSLLSDRIERIVLLLNIQRADLRTLRCIGYIHDSRASCWWIAFDYSTFTNIALSLRVPVSLLDLMMEKAFSQPPLEARLMLASCLANSLSGLFNSSWLHKSIRSENMLFPQLPNLDSTSRLGTHDLASPFLAGFEYSRQNMERSLGKPQNRDIARAIYRHPFYQGQNPGSYRIQYDIYSFGLVLVEIARWVPLDSFLPKVNSKKTGDKSPEKPRDFTEENGKELQKRVLHFVNKELAFRVGTSYRDAVLWCLTQVDEKINSELKQMMNDGAVVAREADWRSPLDFYNNVVVPLERLAIGNRR